MSAVSPDNYLAKFGRGVTVERKASAFEMPTDPILRQIMLGVEAKSGQVVNWRTALDVTTALSCGRVIAESLAQCPFKLHRTVNGRRTVASDHPLSPLVTVRPNDWQTPFEMVEQLALHCVFTGNAFVFPAIAGGRVTELLPLEPSWVQVKRKGWELSYLVRPSDMTAFPVDPSQMWHLRGPSWNGYLGLDAVRMARNALGLAMATEEFGSKLFEKGARPGGILTSDAPLGADAAKRLKDEWSAAQEGSGNAMRTALLSGGLKWQSLSMNADEAQFLETRRFQIEEMCRAFRVMPIMVGHSENNTSYASSEQMFLAHVVYTVAPWAKRIEDSANANLLSDRDREQGYYFKFNLNGLLRGAAKDRAEFYTAGINAGWLTQNDARALEDMDPFDDAAASVPRVPLNTAPLGSEAASGTTA